jgi:hypothetical protein
MANSFEDLSEKFVPADSKKTVKFISNSNSRHKDQVSSSGPSSGDDENDDIENNPNLRFANKASINTIGSVLSTSTNSQNANNSPATSTINNRKSKVRFFC